MREALEDRGMSKERRQDRERAEAEKADERRSRECLVLGGGFRAD
jgi:hypothetical protein